MRAIVPVHEIKRRITEQGRIRMGVKVSMGEGKSRPKKLDRLRFTSADKRAILKIAELYGGDATEWPEGPDPNLWQVTVTADRVPVVLPPDPLSGTPIYELWSGGGCQRRCDGIDCTLAVATDAGPDTQPAVLECQCRAQNKMLCKPRTRLNVVLRDVPFGGTWRLESTGWNAAEELPANVDMVMHVQNEGLATAELGITQRNRMVRGHMKHYVVPSLTLPESILALAEGRMRLTALGQAREVPALPAPAGDWYDDDEIVDAEVIDEDVGAGEGPETSDDKVPPADPLEPPAPTRRVQSPRVKALHAGLRQVIDIPGIDVDVNSLRHSLVMLVTEGRSPSTKDMNDAEEQRALELVDDLLQGRRRFIGVADNGKMRLSQRREETT